MARNAPRLPRPRRGAAAPPVGAAVAPAELATVHGWLSRCALDPAETERLLIEVLRRSRAAAPACLRAASDATRLQYLTVQAVLQLRGVI